GVLPEEKVLGQNLEIDLIVETNFDFSGKDELDETLSSGRTPICALNFILLSFILYIFPLFKCRKGYESLHSTIFRD
ncbi:dihydroneopterin aldolase, partial [Mycobacterium kansasii]